MSDVIRLDDGTTLPNTAKGHIELELMIGDGLVAGASFRRTLLEIGQEFVGSTLPPSYKRMTPRACFQNAFTLATTHSDLRYCEGYALHDVVPLLIHHAWVIDEDDQVIESTWDPCPSDTYFGIVFDLQDVCRVVVETEHYSVMYTRQGNELIKRMGAAK